jgi:hypothetical protein
MASLSLQRVRLLLGAAEVVGVLPVTDSGAGLAGARWQEYKRDAGQFTGLLTSPGSELIIKGLACEGAVARLRALVGRTRLHRQYRTTRRLAAQGLPVVPARALLSASVSGVPHVLLVMDRAQGPTLLDFLARITESDHIRARAQHRVADAAGRLVARVVAKGLFNRDHKPSNIIVTDVGDDQTPASLGIIDAVDFRKVTPTLVFAAPTRMLASMIIEPTGVGVRPRHALMRRALRAYLDESWHLASRSDADSDEAMDRTWEHQSARAFWQSIGERVVRHGDPTPRVNPLAT